MSDVTDRPIRVLWLTKGLGPGGTERLLVEHAAASTNSRFEYSAAYLLPWKDHLVGALEAQGVRTHCLNVRAEADLRWVARFNEIIRRSRIDVVHAHSPLSAAICRPVIRTAFRRVGLVYTEHNRWLSYNVVTRASNAATYSLNDKVFAVSSDVAQSVAPRFQDRVEVLVHGIDVERVRAFERDRETVRRELGIAPGQQLIVTVANLRADKAYPDLLAAAKLAIAEKPSLRFVAVGQGQLETELHTLHRQLGIGDGFRFLGYYPAAARIIAAADVFVLASHHEGLPVAVMEALALGVPIVATAVGGLREAITHGENGLLVRPRRPTELAEAVALAISPAMHLKLAIGARLSGDRYSSRHAVDRIEREYARVG